MLFYVFFLFFFTIAFLIGERSNFVQITAAGIKENHPHEVRIVKEAPNYQVSDG